MAEQAAPSVARLQSEIARLATAAKGVVGVSAWRLDGRGPRIALNAEQRYPLASTFKVAVAGAIMARIDRGELTLGQMIEVDPDKYASSPVIAEELIHPGVSLSVHNLLELMITHSDNTATDVLTELAGGPAGATAWLRAQGITDQRIDRDTRALLRDFFGLPATGPLAEAFERAAKADPSLGERSSRPFPAFDNDVRDTSTPEAMANLLTRIFSGKALKPASTKVLTDIMERTKTGKTRLKGLLPEGTVVAHKTGTIGGTVNDAGVITLPGEAGQIVIAVYIKKGEAPTPVRERTIAEIARAVYDYYLFSAPGD
ncbi:class A beta-lactamase [Sphingosinicella rhizophila]|uniref:beta-lactamase n=1 Tax=Sphingosinicella rhizophila TaxID=3050082 RepID=A0ABU3Q489_9SPHN|nr:class A beta-lactamase [Sphingosinicella sp. GR2756]MDT9598238.1 class A beta-lactamase [Sphingosinicella sp. GR2756]